MPEEKREELFFLIPKLDTLFVPEELHEFPGGREPSQSISIRGSTAQPHCATSTANASSPNLRDFGTA